MTLAAWLLTAALAATPTPSSPLPPSAEPQRAPPPSLAAPGLGGLNLSEAETAFLSDHLAQQLYLQGLKVVTSAEISALIGLERQKQLLGCADDQTNCVVELGAALGVDGLVTGSIGKLGDTYQVNVKVVSTEDGRALAGFSDKAQSQSKLLDVLSDGAKKMARQLGATPREAPPAEAKARRPVWPWVAGGALVAAGGGSVFMATRYASTLRDGVEDGRPVDAKRAQSLRRTGNLFEYGGYALAAAGVGLLGYAALRPASEPQTSTGVQAAVFSDGQSAIVTLGGRF